MLNIYENFAALNKYKSKNGFRVDQGHVSDYIFHSTLTKDIVQYLEQYPVDVIVKKFGCSYMKAGDMKDGSFLITHTALIRKVFARDSVVGVIQYITNRNKYLKEYGDLGR